MRLSLSSGGPCKHLQFTCIGSAMKRPASLASSYGVTIIQDLFADADQKRASVVVATFSMFCRYAELLDGIADETQGDDRLSLANLRWICAEAQIHGEDLPIDKLSRWLGFVQGCLAMRGLISVDVERDVSRPLFYAAYEASGISVPSQHQKSDETAPENNVRAVTSMTAIT